MKKETFFNGLRLAIVLILCALVYLSQSNAAFYCQEYCEAKFGEFVQYSPGKCRCAHQTHDFPFLNMSATSDKVNTSFINVP